MKNQVLTRAYIVAGILILIALALFGQTFRIAVSEGEEWRAKGDSLYIRYVDVMAPRGNILASNGNFLATSQQFYTIRMDTRAEGLSQELFDAGLDSLAALIHTHLNQRISVDSTKRWLSAARAEGDRYLLIGRDVDYPGFQAMSKWPIFRGGSNRGGFIAERSEKRKRPFGMMAQRTIGYQREDISVGLEGRYNEKLGGQAGRRPMMRLPGNHWLPVKDLVDASPSPGFDIQTTIDVTIQDVVQQELAQAVSQHAAEYGVGIVIETATGAIRAMSSLSRESSGFVTETFNHAVGTAVEPGSTFKLASMLALLDDKRVRLDDTVRVFGGKYKFYDREMVDSKLHGLDSITARQAFEMSSNVGISRLVDIGYGNNSVGRKKYVDKIRSFQLDRTTGVEIDGEATPMIKDPHTDSMRNWSGVTLPWMSMGYEIQLTPLQMAAFYNAVANGGTYMQPMLVTNIQREGRIIESFEPKVIAKKIASPEAIRDAQSILKGVVERGTAKGYRSKLYSFAGKTGTVQYNYSEAAKKKGLNGHQASFIGYFPAEKPKYTVLVLISRPRSGNIYGSDVALPVWRNIVDKIYAADINLRPAIHAKSSPQWRANTIPVHVTGSASDVAAIFATLDVPNIASREQGMISLSGSGDSLTVKPVNFAPGRIPDVRGMGARDALFLLENAGCRVDISGRGTVKRQSIAPGTKANGQYIKLTLG